jgi:polyisoprenoid-binding protein YceI
MKYVRNVKSVKALVQTVGLVVAVALVMEVGQAAPQAQGAAQVPVPGRAGGARQTTPPPDPTRPVKLEITEGTTARYKVREQLAGINFPSDAVGTTQTVTGTIVINPDGSLDAKQSKLTVDLRTIKSDQQMRDGFVQSRTLETDKFPFIEFVPTRAEGLPKPLPAAMQAQAGFKLIGDMTLHGVTKEVTWTVIATFGADQVAGRATTTLAFADFKMTKPSLARLMSVDDKIELEIEFRCKRTAL